MINDMPSPIVFPCWLVNQSDIITTGNTFINDSLWTHQLRDDCAPQSPSNHVPIAQTMKEDVMGETPVDCKAMPRVRKLPRFLFKKAG